jgi:hypothetical protein
MNALLWVVGPLCLLIVLYVGGYFVLGESTGAPGVTVRSFRSSAAAFAYFHLAWLELKIRRRDVYLGMPGRSELGGRLIHFEP